MAVLGNCLVCRAEDKGRTNTIATHAEDQVASKVATVAVDVFYHDTYFVVAHFHYTIQGGAVIGLIAALHFWFPKMSGKMYNEGLSKISWFLIFLGFNVTFMPQFIAGSKGMPRRYYDYIADYTIFNKLSTIGSWIIGFGFLIAAFYLFYAMFFGPKASGNPWNAATLEWDSPSPPPIQNFEKDPIVTKGPYDYSIEVDHG